MSNYQRLISYIYTYEGGIKGKNIGFAKLETRGAQCRLTVSVKKIFVGGNPLGVYLLSDQKEVKIGTLFARNGAGEFRATVNSGNVEGSGLSIEQFYGLSVHDVESAWRSYTTIWEDAIAHAAEVELADVTSENVAKKQERGEPGQAPAEAEVLPISHEIEKELEQEALSEVAVREDVLRGEAVRETAVQRDTAQRDTAQRETAQEKLTREELVREEAERSVRGRTGNMRVDQRRMEQRLRGWNRDTVRNIRENMMRDQAAVSAVADPPVSSRPSEGINSEPSVIQSGDFAGPECGCMSEMPVPEGPGPEMPLPGGPGPEIQTPGGPGPEIPMPGDPGSEMPLPGGPGPKIWTPEGPGPEIPMPGGPGPEMPQPGGPGPEIRTPEGPGPEIRTPEGPGPEIPMPEGPGPEIRTPGGPGPEIPMPEGPGPEIRTPGGPGPEIRTPGGPGPEIWTPEGPDPEIPMPEGPGPEIRTPGDPGPEMPQPRASGPEIRTPGGPGPEMPQPEAPADGVPISASTWQRNRRQSDTAGSGALRRPYEAGMPGNRTGGAGPAYRQQRPLPTPPPAGIPSPNDEKDSRTQEEMWQILRKKYPKILAFDYADGCEILTVKPQDIGILPRETWVFGNNSFLLHGYYNYRYLILARLNNPKGAARYLLGVPGHYYSNEKYMASMFGFPNFVLSKKQPSGDGRFGYWYTDIRVGE